MPKIAYEQKKPSESTLATIVRANRILVEYEKQGFTLTLRQLYYQFVARDLIENTQKSYNRLGNAINTGRMVGLIDWSHLEDRTRNVRQQARFEDAPDALHALADQYHVDLWVGQRWRPEVWIEKDALIGVIEKVCNELDIPYFSCRGYVSQSEMWRAGRRHQFWSSLGYRPVILHLGDHDPSGVDMTRDIYDRLDTFAGEEIPVIRLALNMDQINRYNPPPNPAKITDSRAASYIDEFGHESWELDSLEPSVIIDLIDHNAKELRDDDKWKERVAEKEATKARLLELAKEWK